MTRADYRNLRADQKNNDIVPSEMASWDELNAELDHLRALSQSFRAGMAVGYAMAQANVPLTRTKDDNLTRSKGEC